MNKFDFFDPVPQTLATMCEQEKKELEILLTEARNQSQIFKQPDHPILVSLQNGIQKAEKRLQTCEYNKCMSQFYDMNPATASVSIPLSTKRLNLNFTRQSFDKFLECISLH